MAKVLLPLFLYTANVISLLIVCIAVPERYSEYIQKGSAWPRSLAYTLLPGHPHQSVSMRVLTAEA